MKEISKSLVGGLAIFAVGLFSPPVVQADTHHVWPDSPGSAPPYLTWETAATNIQDAVAIASSGATVLVTNGTFEGMAVDKAILVQSVNGPNVTKIHMHGESAETYRSDLEFGSVYLGSNAVLSGFTVWGGRAPEGGGVFAETFGVVTNCVITDNFASRVGGGVHGGTLFDCVITGNYAYEAGGVASSILYRCQVTANGAETSGGASQSTLYHCTVSNNHADSEHAYGGGVRSCYLYDCQVIGNTATGHGSFGQGAGGGAYGSTLIRCTVSGNSMSGPYHAMGGGVHACIVEDSVISSNSVTSALPGDSYAFGGGANKSTLHNCLLIANTAYAAGSNVLGYAAFSAGGGAGSSILYQCTVTGNSAWTDTAGGNGGGVNYSTNYNCIVYGNSAPKDPEYSDATFYYSCTTPLPVRGEGNIVSDPVFVNPSAGDFHLLHGSPCIDSGTNLSAIITNDLDALPRPLDGDGDGVAVFDMGAYEFTPSGDGPVIVVQPVSRTNVVGSSLMFSVTATGPTALAYRWFKDGIELFGSTDPTLVLTDVQVSDAGAYQVKVLNPGGDVLSSDAVLSVIPSVPPTLLATPRVNPFNGHEYYLLKSSTWAEAETAAEAMGGHLVTVSDQAEQDWLLSTFGNWEGQERLLWIGFYDSDPANNSADPVERQAEFAWASGEHSTITNWQVGQPNNYGNAGEYYVHLRQPSHVAAGQWNDAVDTRGDTIPFHGVVELEPSRLVPILAGPLFNPETGSDYYLLDQSTWAAAETTAQAMGGHLVTINSQAEQEWVFNMVGNWDAQERMLWIGLRDTDPEVNSSDPSIRQAEFEWVSGELVTYANWQAGQPNNYGDAGEFWVHLRQPSHAAAGQWNDTLDGWGDAIPFNGVVEVPADAVTMRLLSDDRRLVAGGGVFSDGYDDWWWRKWTTNVPSPPFVSFDASTSAAGGESHQTSDFTSSSLTATGSVSVDLYVEVPFGVTHGEGISLGQSTFAVTFETYEYYDYSLLGSLTNWAEVNGELYDQGSHQRIELLDANDGLVFSHDSDQLQITDAGWLAPGVYTLVAEVAVELNLGLWWVGEGAGHFSLDFDLGITPAEIVTQPASSTGVVGGSVTMGVTAEGTQPIQYQWFKEEAPLVGATNQMLQLADLQLSDAGSYRVRVRNSGGEALSSDAVVTVVDAELPPVLAGPILNPANGHAYYLLNQSTWTEAELAAVAWGGHLVAIGDQAEQDWVFGTFGHWGGQERLLWIGLHDRDPANNANDPLLRQSEFVWTSGEPVTYVNWQPGQPNNYGDAGEFYAHMRQPSHADAGQWNDTVDDGGSSPIHGIVERETPELYMVTAFGEVSYHHYNSNSGEKYDSQETGSGDSFRVVGYHANVEFGPTSSGFEAHGHTYATGGFSTATLGSSEYSRSDCKISISLAQPYIIGADFTKSFYGRNAHDYALCYFNFDLGQEAIWLHPFEPGGFQTNVALPAGYYEILVIAEAGADSPGQDPGDSGEAEADYDLELTLALDPVAGTLPTITVQPLSSTNTVGSSLALTVAAEGPDPLSYQWFKDGEALPGATVSALTLTEVQLADAGTYQVRVRNYHGETFSSDAVVTVLEMGLPSTLTGPAVNPENGNVYHLLEQSTWTDAEAAAVAMGGHLVTITDQAEQDWVFNKFANWDGQERLLWIGLYDPDQADNATDPVERQTEFAWACGEPVTYANWQSGQPNNYGGAGELYAHMRQPSHAAAGQWNDTTDVDFSVFPFHGVVEISRPATPMILYVSLDSTNPTAPYLTWATAATNIQHAVDAAMAGDTVLVTNGVYVSGGRVATGLRSNRVVIDKAITVASVNGPDATQIAGKHESQGVPGMRCVYLADSALLSGFTLRDGDVSSGANGEEYSGGGVYCEPFAIVTNCVLRSNRAGGGGGVYGGTLSDCVITNCIALSHAGGALSAELHGCLLIDNAASAEGGGAVECMVFRSRIIRNSSYWGAGAYYSTLYGCVLADNQGDMGSGVLGCTVFNSVITHNSGHSPAVLDGSLYNCIVAWNTGGVYESTSYNCTIALNAGLGANGGSMQNCIISNNGRNVPDEDDPNWGILIPGLYMCYVGENPGFVAPGDGDLHLLPSSPCIDTGTNLSAIVTNDLDGLPRPLDGNGDGIAEFDMGAYEFDLRTVVPANWLTGYGLDPNDPHVLSQNPDIDPFTTYQEWMADTNPTNELSWFRIESISNGPPVAVYFLSSSNRFYSLHRAGDLASGEWSEVEGQISVRGSGGMDSLSDDADATQAFYSLEVTPESPDD